jgi:hypothetical protein
LQPSTRENGGQGSTRRQACRVADRTATTFKLSINLKTAKAMNRTVPAGLVLRADKLIE